MAAVSATGVIAVRLSGNARSMGAAASRAGRAAPTGVARRASRRVVAAAGADRCVAGKAHAREERVVAVGPTPFGFASASLARTFCHRLSRGASFAAAASSGGADAGDDDDDAPVHLTEEEREALDAEAAAMASSWASELSAAAWDDADSAETSDFSTTKKKKTRDKSLRAAVANESYDEDDDDFEENYYDYDADLSLIHI